MSLNSKNAAISLATSDLRRTDSQLGYHCEASRRWHLHRTIPPSQEQTPSVEVAKRDTRIRIVGVCESFTKGLDPYIARYRGNRITSQKLLPHPHSGGSTSEQAGDLDSRADPNPVLPVRLPLSHRATAWTAIILLRQASLGHTGNSLPSAPPSHLIPQSVMIKLRIVDAIIPPNQAPCHCLAVLPFLL